MCDALQAFDRELFLAINNGMANPVLDVFFVWITTREFWIIPGLLAAAVFVRQRKRQALSVLILLGIALVASDSLCVRVLKPLFARARPCHPAMLVEGGRFLLGHRTSLSFPSAHAMNSATAAALLAALYPKRWPWFAVAAVLVSLSRVYVGVHFPLDVLAGACAGVALAALIVQAVRRWWPAQGPWALENLHREEQACTS